MNFEFPLAIFAALIVVCVILLLYVSWIFSETSNYGDDPFECGFEPGGVVRLPFSIEYFLIGVIFVVFETELVICLPMIWVAGANSWLVSWFLVAELLGIGFLLEVVLSTLEWKS